MKKKVIVIGIDGVPPELLFDKYLDSLPNIQRIIKQSKYGKLRSIDPPITIPAWACMMSGQNPGSLGIYGFRNRKDYSYSKLFVATSVNIKKKRVWDVLSEHNKKSIIIGVPPSYPPVKLNGCCISCFITPENANYTYPDSLANEIEEKFGKYIFDIKNFRTEDKEYIYNEAKRFTEQRFNIFRYLIENKEWEFAMMVDMGPDRIHHGLWKFFDENHKKYVKDNVHYEKAKEYYKLLDKKIGEIYDLKDEDTLFLVVSDHGCKKMDGGIAINEWLIENNYLKLKSYPDEIIRIDNADIDWKNTLCWGEGGYYGRLFFNLKGREPDGTIAPEEYAQIKEKLKKQLEDITDETGKNIGTKVYEPGDLYEKIDGIAPDLIVYFGDLDYRSVGSIGHKKILIEENDTGPDDANHSKYGIFIINHKDLDEKNKQEEMKLIDIGPLILDYFDISFDEKTVSKGFNIKKIIKQKKNNDEIYTKEEEEEITKRLEDLGYI